MPSLALTLAIAGCATRSTANFKDVEQTVNSRTGQNIKWPGNKAEKERSDSLVAELLKTNLTAETVVQVTLLNNRSLRATLEQIGISQSEVVQAGLLPNPNFSASVRLPDRPPSGANSEFSLSGEFLDLLLLPLRKRVARDQYEQTRLKVSHEILQMTTEAKILFYTVQARQQFIHRLQAVLEINEAAMDLSQRQHDAGNISELDLASQRGSFQQAHLELVKAQAQLRADRERLNRVLGVSGKNLEWKVGELPALPEKEIDFADLEKLAASQRLDLAAAENQSALAGRALALRSKTRYLPASVRLGVDTEHDPSHTQLTGPTLDLELPIFDQGQGAISRLQAQQRQAQFLVEALMNDIHSEVRQARDAMMAARELAQFYSTAYLPQQIRIVAETLIQYNAMHKSPFDLIAAKERELHAEREYTEAWRDYWIAHAELEKAVGGRLPQTFLTDGAKADPLHTQQQNSETDLPHEHK